MNNIYRKFSSGLLLSALILGMGASAIAAPPVKANNLKVVPMVTSVDLVGGDLVASGVAYVTIKGKTYADTFTAPVTLTPMAAPTEAGCPVLNLELGPIHLNLLGLVVDTSKICLTITAYEGGGLLGDLLCDLSGLLSGGVPVGDALTLLEGAAPGSVNNLLGGLTGVLNQALRNLLGAVLGAITDAQSCDILNLSLGPVQLNLLGLEVLLNNCAATPGPITVDITGQGGLLGNLLCGLLGGGQIQLGSTLQDILGQLLGVAALQ